MTGAELLQHLVFFIFAGVLLCSALMVVISRNPVRGVLFLVLGFFASSVLWMMLEAEFLALVLIFVYVGAVMTLFLFVVMMLNIQVVPSREGFVRYLPFGVLVMVLLCGLMLMVIGPKHFGLTSYAPPPMESSTYSNVKELGGVLYTKFMYPFEIAAVVLLVSIIAAISLAFRGRQNSKSQRINEQLKADKKNRLRIVDIKADSEGDKS